MRTGVPVDRILEFNAEGGNALDPQRLQVGQPIYVPLGESDIQDRPRTAAEVQMMRDEANGVSYFENPRFRTPAEVEADWARAASLDAPAPSVGPPPPVEEQSLLDFVWRDFDWRSVGQTAFGAAADIGDSVGAFAQGFGGGLVDMGTGAVLGAAELAALNAKLNYGTPRERVEALQALWGMGGAVVDHTLESGRYLVHGVTNPGDVLDAMAQLGIQGSAEQVGRATASAEGTVSSLYGMAGPIRSLGRRIVSGADEAAEAGGRARIDEAAEAIGPKPPRSPLGRDVVESFPDPAPTTYRSGLRPDTPVVDHIKARGLGGDPVDPANLHEKAWSENARKGWHEGEYLRQRRELMQQGLSRQQAEWVLEDYLRWIMNDIHATPSAPAKLNKLPSP